MSYVDRHLMDGEQVAYRTRRHWIIYGWPIFFLCVGVTLFGAARFWDYPDAPTIGNAALGLAVALALLAAIPPWIERLTSEFAVTNKRVIVKIGWIQRRSDETLLTKIEGIEVIQGIWGRILGYGTIIITGTGGSKEPFATIAAPLEFRRKVQEQILALRELR